VGCCCSVWPAAADGLEEETEGAEDPLKWGELGLGCSADCSGEREGRSAEKEKRSAAGG
jgi:hypothetical protein